MEQGFRSSMNVLHTWAGVVIGALLFAIFWMGTLAVYRPRDRPLDGADDPDGDAGQADLVRSVARYLRCRRALPARGPGPCCSRPSGNRSCASSIATSPQVLVALLRSGRPAPHCRKQGPGPVRAFFYPFHYRLHLRAWDIGEWLVGIAAMTMLLLCVSGLVIHRKIIRRISSRCGRGKNRRAWCSTCIRSQACSDCRSISSSRCPA